MANGQSITEDPEQDGGGPPPGPDPDAPGGGAPGGPPQGGGPVLAALARRQTGPQVTAPGPGDHADALTKVQNAVALIQQALPSLPQGSPVHTAALQAVTRLSRHMAQGAPAAGVQQTQLMDMLRSTMRNALLQKIMGNQAAAGQQGGAPPMPGGAPAQAPMPSTPLPGA